MILKKMLNVGIVFVLLFTANILANAENCTSVYKVTATQLNIRSQASTQGDVIGTLQKGEQVCINKESRNWGRTSTGWISKKHLVLLNDNSNQNPVKSASTSGNQSSDDSAGNGAIILGVLIVLAFIFFGLKTLFYHTLISLGMAEPDGRAKNGIRLTRLGKFMASISGLIIFFIFMLIGSMSE